MSGARCDAACRQHPSCALGAIGDYLVEACDAVEAELDSAWHLSDASAFERMAMAVQLMHDAVGVVDHRVADLRGLGLDRVCAEPGECSVHPLCVGQALQARVRATSAIVVVTIEDLASRFRLLNPLAVTPLLADLRRWVAQRLEVHDLEASLALPEEAS